MMCDNCVHNAVCCDEGKDEGLTFCADFMKKHKNCSGITNEEEQYFRDMLSLVCAGCAYCWDSEKCKECLFSKLSERAIEALKWQRPHGEWKPDGTCSECGVYSSLNKDTTYFCPNCGADMRNEAKKDGHDN